MWIAQAFKPTHFICISSLFSGDVVIMNNVFEFFLTRDMQERSVQFRALHVFKWYLCSINLVVILFGSSSRSSIANIQQWPLSFDWCQSLDKSGTVLNEKHDNAVWMVNIQVKMLQNSRYISKQDLLRKVIFWGQLVSYWSVDTAEVHLKIKLKMKLKKYKINVPFVMLICYVFTHMPGENYILKIKL